MLGLSPWLKPAWAQERATANAVTGTAPVLTGTEFDLIVEETAVNFTGAPRMAVTINGSLPSPTLHWREGDTVTIRVHNRLAEDTSIHWHGILLPYQMDGVPGISFKGIPPGETFTYQFKVAQSGTYWYHSHSGMQEQKGMLGAIIIDPVGADPIHADRDYIVQLSDWTDEDPHRVFAKLKKQSDYYNEHRWSRRQPEEGEVTIYYLGQCFSACSLLNVSSDGMLIKTPEISLPCSAFIDLTFNVPGVEARQLRGLVVHRTEQDARIMFVDVLDATHNHTR